MKSSKTKFGTIIIICFCIVAVVLLFIPGFAFGKLIYGTNEVVTETEEILTPELQVLKEKNENIFGSYDSTIPVVYISKASGVTDFYLDCYVSIDGNNAFGLEDGAVFKGAAEIKLRGNSTKTRAKKPLKLKLNTKTNLLGMGESKHWVLLADDIDHTLIRNKLVMDFARDIGMETASNSYKVAVVYNGSYQGVYTLCEHVRVGKDQVDIFDYSELAEDIAEKIFPLKKNATANTETERKRAELKAKLESDYNWLSEPYEFEFDGVSYVASDYEKMPELTGGFLLEGDFYNVPSSATSLQTYYLQPFYFNTPETGATNKELKRFAGKYIQSFEYALHSKDFCYHEDEAHYMATNGRYDWGTGWQGNRTAVQYSDPEHDGWRYDDFFDMDSLVQNFLVCEFTRNWDSMKNSMFLYKDTAGKAFMGPCWDYDWAFGNINMYNIYTNIPEGWQTTDNYFTYEQYYQSFNWNRYLIQDEIFVDALYKKWHEIRPTIIEGIIKEDGTLSYWRDTLRDEGLLNDKKWSHTYRQYNSVGYEESWDNLEEFIRLRIAWLDKQFTDPDTLYRSLNSYWQAH